VAVRRVPPPLSASIVKLPPTNAARSCILVSPLELRGSRLAGTPPRYFPQQVVAAPTPKLLRFAVQIGEALLFIDDVKRIADALKNIHDTSVCESHRRVILSTRSLVA
jgi:hypothetical protein